MKKKKKYEQKTNQVRKDYVIKKREESYNPYSLEQVLQLLPDVGDRLMRVPTEVTCSLRPCTVIEVNPIGRWYRVRFDSGYCECFKVPEV